ncbi:hypothetical protein [Parasporobacterium paucivorans]|uniref:Uncharacterized protein n=1 Tax=Parasporobacterium paucivorans DSM 15970 TaxID=1122934 RepID=A0A1M6JV63_9FIRM|nr:hypothetical protein [Parasporobacterium paucivorans]SHJ50604.1 hypothetical protein SAMN02745691_02078 [Parasporobacterium paucivorans DSM 15970]
MKGTKIRAKISLAVCLIMTLTMAFSSNQAFAANPVDPVIDEQNNNIANYGSMVNQLKEQPINTTQNVNSLDFEKIELINSVKTEAVNTQYFYESEPNNQSYQADILDNNFSGENNYYCF